MMTAPPFGSVSLVYFSGTGNTEAVTDCIAAEFKRKTRITVDVLRVEDVLKHGTHYDPEKYDLIGIGYPIYGFNPPGNIFTFAKGLENIQGKKIFIYSTSAGPFYLNDIASCGLKNILRKKGADIVYEKQFFMPSNIAIRYNDDVAKQLCNAAFSKAATMVDEILLLIRKVRNDGILPLFFTWAFAVMEKMSWWTVPFDFRILRSCNFCMICVRSCPQRNISATRNKIRFRFHCLLCYRCVYNCPKNAITGRFYKFAILKEGYNIRKIIQNDKIKGDHINDRTKGYYKVFLEYLNN